MPVQTCARSGASPTPDPASPTGRRGALRGLLAGSVLAGGVLADPRWAQAQPAEEPAPAARPALPPAPASAASGTEPPPGSFVDVPIWEGLISFYGRGFAGRRTANGERFDPRARTMAHRFLPFGSWVKVTVLPEGPSVVVRVNDRGPAVAGRIGDLSHAAAKALGMLGAGVVRARLELLKEGPDRR